MILPLLLTLALAPAGGVAPEAQASRCRTRVCTRRVKMKRKVRPRRIWLRNLRHCETRDRNIHDPSGTYHGFYQFDERSWGGAGGSGDPHNASKLEQGYRAVVWDERHGGDPWPNC